MLGAASHEFRNPISGLISILALLENGISEEFKSYLNVAKSSADLMLFLANDLLDYSQLESGKLKLFYQGFNVYNTCNDIVELFRFKAESKGIAIHLSDSLRGITIH